MQITGLSGVGAIGGAHRKTIPPNTNEDTWIKSIITLLPSSDSSFSDSDKQEP